MTPRTESLLSRSLRSPLGWALAGTACAGVAWALGLLLGWYFLGVNIARSGLDSAEPAAAFRLAWVGAGWGLVVGSLGGLLTDPRGRGVAGRLTSAGVWGAGLAVAAATGGALSVLAVILTGEFVPPELSSSLGFATTGLIVGLAGYEWSRSRTGAGRPHLLWATVNAIGWALVCAASTGLAWASSLLTGRYVLGVDIAPVHHDAGWGGAALLTAAVGALCGFVVAMLGCVRVRRRSWLRARGVADVLFWCVGLSLAAAVGGFLSVFAVVQSHGVLWPEVASSLGFATAGLLAGFAGCVWTRQTAEPESPAAADLWDDEEEPGRPAGKGQAWVPAEPGPSFYAPVLRLLPVAGVSGLSLIAAALVPAHALPLLAVGLLGSSVLGALWGQELHLRELARQPRTNREP